LDVGLAEVFTRGGELRAKREGAPIVDEGIVDPSGLPLTISEQVSASGFFGSPATERSSSGNAVLQSPLRAASEAAANGVAASASTLVLGFGPRSIAA